MGLIPGSAQAPALPSTPILISFAKKRRADKQAVQEVQRAIDAARLTLVTLCSRAGLATRSSSASKPLIIRIPARASPSRTSKPVPAQSRGEKPNYDSQTGLLTRGFSYSATLLWQSGRGYAQDSLACSRISAYVACYEQIGSRRDSKSKGRAALADIACDPAITLPSPH